MMLVAFGVGENFCSISAQKITKEIFENTYRLRPVKVHALHYANELLVRVRLSFKNFCKLAKQTETIRNYQKQGLFMIKYCFGNSQINSMLE